MVLFASWHERSQLNRHKSKLKHILSKMNQMKVESSKLLCSLNWIYFIKKSQHRYAVTPRMLKIYCRISIPFFHINSIIKIVFPLKFCFKYLKLFYLVIMSWWFLSNHLFRQLPCKKLYESWSGSFDSKSSKFMQNRAESIAFRASLLPKLSNFSRTSNLNYYTLSAFYNSEWGIYHMTDSIWPIQYDQQRYLVRWLTKLC